MIRATDLLCNDTENPLGIDDLSPIFSWKTVSDEKNALQTSYRIRVARADAPDKALWDSGKIASGVSVSIPYSGEKLEPMTAYAWSVKQWDKYDNESEWSDTAFFETGLMGTYRGQWIGPTNGDKTWRKPDPLPAPMLRKSFILPTKAKKARVYVCGLGYYNFLINGKKVSDKLLCPVLSQYNEKVYYDTFDITELLREGENVFAVTLGNGWYNSYTKDPWNFAQAPWRDRPKLWLESHIELDGGESIAVISDHTWKYSFGPVVADGLRHGETYDARLKKDGWSEPGYDDKDFIEVQIKRSPGGIRTSRQITPIRRIETLKAVKILEGADGARVYDFGKNVSGYVRIKAKGYEDAEIVFRYSEKIDENNNIDREKISAYIYSGEFQTDHYTMRGNEIEEWTPSFTYHGFRYVEITGYPGEYTDEAFTADVIYTDFTVLGDFNCSDESLNKLHAASMLATLTNFHGMPEDCPHREKNGWTGDAWISAEQLLLNFDARRDYRKWLSDIRDCQRPDGHLPGCVPTADWGYRRTGIIWGAALLFIPWYQYLYCGDKRIIEENYEASKRFVQNTADLEVDGTVTHDGESARSFGDWMPPGGNLARKCSVVLMETATYYTLLSVLSKMAYILEKQEEGEFYYHESLRIKDCFNKKYIKDGLLTVRGCMTAYGCLAFNELDDGSFLEQLKAESLSNGGIADFGFHGMKYVLQSLIDGGMEDIAYKIVKNRKYPGWLYMLDSGATTLWETWEGDLSQNHHAFSDVDTFFYKALAGIRMDPQNPGFKHFFLKPYTPDDISYVTASHVSPYGKIESAWERNGNTVIYKFRIPENTEATVILPNGSSERVGSGEHIFST